MALQFERSLLLASMARGPTLACNAPAVAKAAGSINTVGVSITEKIDTDNGRAHTTRVSIEKKAAT